jgi:hypothetical protein
VVAGTALERFPTAPELADHVVEALNARSHGRHFCLLKATVSGLRSL